MEKRYVTETSHPKTIHKFYCDGCGKLLGKSEEWDDGWYEVAGKFEMSFYVDDKVGWMKKEANYCAACRKKAIKEIIDTLKKLGFEKERD